MIGVFDSGAGGLFSLAELRRLSPNADIAFFADTKNAPYGSKGRDELISLVVADIDRLFGFGCEKILMACCTASSVYGLLPDRCKRVSVPIIEPTSREALRLSKNKKIGIISTEATKKSRAFVEEILKQDPSAEIISAKAPELVSLAEGGERDGSLSRRGIETIEKCVSIFHGTDIDTLILGCTHFAYFENKIKEILNVSVVNSARVGAAVMKDHVNGGNGRVYYLS